MTKRKEKEEPAKVYQVRNVIDRENWITCGWTNEPTLGLLAKYTGLFATALWLTRQHYTTLLHYTTLPGSTTSCGKCTHPTFETTVICSFTRQTDRCTPQRMASKVVLNAKTALSRLCSSLPCTVVRKSCQNGLQPKHSYVYCGLHNYIHIQLGNLPMIN